MKEAAHIKKKTAWDFVPGEKKGGRALFSPTRNLSGAFSENIAVHFCAIMLLLFTGCRGDNSVPGTSTLGIEFSFGLKQNELVCRGEEDTIRCVTLYLSGKDFLYFEKFRSERGESLLVECPKGEYDCYCMANVEDFECESVQQLKKLWIDTGRMNALCAHEEVSVKEGAKALITLRRCRTKVKIDIRVAPEKQDEISLLSCRILSMPLGMQPFGDERPEAYYDSEDMPAAAKHSTTVEFEMLENLAGENEDILGEQDRTKENAPKGATSLLVRARNRNEILYYHVMLGENTTTSFNLRRNTEYSISLDILGDSLFEQRISRYEIFSRLKDDGKILGYFIAGDEARYEVTTVASEESSLEVSFEVIGGEKQYVTVNGELPSASKRFELASNGTTQFLIGYRPDVITESNSELALSVRFHDKTGYTFENLLELSYINAVEISSLSGGHIEILSEGTKFLQRQSTSRFLAGTIRDEITLHFTKSPSFRFLGWWVGGEFLKSGSLRLPILSCRQEQKLDVEYWADKIFYTTTDRQRITISKQISPDAELLSNSYQDGEGVIRFDMDLESLLKGAFTGQDRLLSITLPDRILSMDDSIFEGCTSLCEVTLPPLLQTISKGCFQRCEHLRSITLPEQVIRIDEGAFSGCSRLESVLMDEALREISKNAFYLSTSLESIIIPDAVEKISDWAFYSCLSLREVSLSENLSHLGHYAFEGCSLLGAVTLPRKLSYLGEGAFGGCSSLSRVEFLSATPPVLGFYSNSTDVFSGCGALKSILVPKGAADAYRKAFPNHQQIISEN